jgi:putative hydrolase of the HAD superfamily
MLARRHLLHPVARKRQSRKPAVAGAERVWLFDLDNTLHDCSHAIFPHIDRGMTAAVAEALGVDDDTANEYRKRYWKRYGATVIGMVRHHGVSAAEFLRRCHDFDLAPLIRSESGLADKLRRLPGRKVLLTNAPFEYARKVLRHLGLLQQFDSLWALEHMHLQGQYRPKPSPALLRYVLAREGVLPARAVLVEDTLANLRGARQAGLRTVHVYHPGTPFSRFGHCRPGYVDLRVNSVTDLLVRRRPLRA